MAQKCGITITHWQIASLRVALPLRVNTTRRKAKMLSRGQHSWQLGRLAGIAHAYAALTMFTWSNVCAAIAGIKPGWSFLSLFVCLFVCFQFFRFS